MGVLGEVAGGQEADDRVRLGEPARARPLGRTAGGGLGAEALELELRMQLQLVAEPPNELAGIARAGAVDAHSHRSPRARRDGNGRALRRGGVVRHRLDPRANVVGASEPAASITGGCMLLTVDMACQLDPALAREIPERTAELAKPADRVRIAGGQRRREAIEAGIVRPVGSG